MELTVVDAKGQPAGSATVAEETFGREFNEPLVHQVLTAYLAGARAGTRAQKNRARVRGGGSKPWRQKGTGRARAGTIRSPLWRGGGVTFAAQPQNHAQKVNKKMYRGAMRSIFSELVRQERLLVIDDFAISEAKTRLAAAMLAELGVADQRVLLVNEQVDEKLALAVQNLPRAIATDIARLNPEVLIGCEKVVVTRAALGKIGEWLG